MKITIFFLRKYKSVIMTLVVLGIISDIFLIRFKSDLITFAILALVFFSFKFYKITSKMTFLLGIIPTVIIFLYFLVDSESLFVEKAAIWLFLLLGLGIIQELFISKKNEKI